MPRIPIKDLSIAAVAGLLGFAIHCLQLTLFPGILLVFGSALALLVAVRYGAAGAGAAGTEQAERVAREAQERARHVAALNAVGQELASTFDLQSICRAALRYVQTQVEAPVFLISLYDETEQVFTSAYLCCEGREFDVTSLPLVKMGTGAHSRCIRTKSPILVDDVEQDRRGAVTTHYFGGDTRWPQSILYLPLMAFDNVVGTLQVQGYERDQYRPEDIERLMGVASQIAIAISNARLFDQVARGKAKWEMTFDGMSDALFVFDESGRLTRVNRAGAEMAGASFKSLIGRRCCDLLSDLVERRCLVTEALSGGQRLVHETTPRRDGRSFVVTVEPMRVEGQVAGAICVVRDLSDLRRVEEEARMQRELISQLVEFAQEAIYTFDAEGRATWFNHRLCEVTGYSAEELQNFDLSQLVYPEDLPELRRRVARVFKGAPENFEGRFIRRDGGLRWYKSSYTPVTKEGRVTGVLAVTRDVTDERRTAEELQQTNKLAAVGQLASGVAHDFNNLLVVILGRAQLLKRQVIGAEARRGLEMIETAALDGAATVRRLQNFARRRVDEQVEWVSVEEILRDVLELTRTRWRDDAQARGIVYDVSLHGGAPGAAVMGSPSELREVLTNLVINALDAMPSGGRLAIESQRRDEAVVLRVMDTGTGMSEEVRQRIFEPFYTTKGHAGTGLGLAVSYGIIERHGGSIEAASEPGSGTIFTITLPLATRAGAAPPKEESNQRVAPVRALIIDDEDLVRQTLAEVLKALGHEVAQATTGREGLRLLETSKFDVVFTDLSMPEMDGWTVARNVRERWPDVKVLLVTGYGATVELTGEAAILADAVIGKPFVFDDITATLERVAINHPSLS